MNQLVPVIADYRRRRDRARRHQDRQSHVPRVRHHCVPCQWRRTGARSGNGGTREPAHDQALRSDEVAAHHPLCRQNRPTVTVTMNSNQKPPAELLGGRIDIVGGNPAPTLVYKRRQHLVSVTELRADIAVGLTFRITRARRICADRCPALSCGECFGLWYHPSRDSYSA
jgi:hypothetical protein